MTSRFVALTAIALVPALAQEDEGKLLSQTQPLPLEPIFYTMNGVGYQNDKTLSGLTKFSMAGGAPMTISGANMGLMPEKNTVMFTPTWLEGVEIAGPALTCNNIISFFIFFLF